MIDVKRAKSRPSKTRKNMRTIVTGGEKDGQAFHSLFKQVMKCMHTKKRECKLKVAM